MSDGDKLTTGDRKQSRGDGGSGRGGRRSRRGRSGRPRRSSNAYKRKVEERLFGKREDAARLRLAERLREAHDTPNFLRIYREYTKGFGLPEEMDLLLLCLDLGDERELLRLLEKLGEVAATAPQEQKSLLRSRLRNLEMSASTDSVAYAAADLLGEL